MSLCFRTISHKFTSLVNTRKQVTKIDRKLPKNVKSSFLDEFLGLQTSVEAKTNLPDRNLEAFTDIDLLYQNRIPISIKSHMKWNKTLVKSYTKDKNKILHTDQQSLLNHYKITNIEPRSVTNLSLYNITTDCKEKENKFLTRNVTLTVNNDIDNSMYDNRYSFNRRLSDATMNTNITPNTTLLVNGTINVQEDRKEQPIKKNEDRPSRDHLEHVFQCLSRDLPKFFIQTMDYTIYSPEIIFVNNIKGTTTKGIFAYVKQVAFLRTIGHLKFAYVRLEVIKITIDPEDDSIKVRWRIRGISGMKVFFTFWKFKLWKIQETIKNADVWYDGFSTYYVDANGRVYKHIADKMMPDQDHLYDKEKEAPVVTKLAMCVGLEDLKILSSNEFVSKLKNDIMFNVK